MNRTHHLIFNRTRGCVMAVGENARSCGGGGRARSAIKRNTAKLPAVDPASSSHYVVETGPRFANFRRWMSSDYMLSALAMDPAQVQKRLGDGFYEQKLIREQVLALTDYRFLGDYTSDDAQYQALMNTGVTFVKASNSGDLAMLEAKSDIDIIGGIVTAVSGLSVDAGRPRFVQAGCAKQSLCGGGFHGIFSDNSRHQ